MNGGQAVGDKAVKDGVGQSSFGETQIIQVRKSTTTSHQKDRAPDLTLQSKEINSPLEPRNSMHGVGEIENSQVPVTVIPTGKLSQSSSSTATINSTPSTLADSTRSDSSLRTGSVNSGSTPSSSAGTSHVGIGDSGGKNSSADPRSVTSSKPQDSTAEADLPLSKDPSTKSDQGSPSPKRPYIPVGGDKEGPVNKVAAFFTTIFLLIFSFICFICLWGSTRSGASKLGKVDFISKISNKISGNTAGRSGLVRIEEPRGGLLDRLPLHQAIQMGQVTMIKKDDVDLY